MTTLSHEIVGFIIDDLTDRKGLRQVWDEIDEDIQQEIFNKWKRIVESHIETAYGSPKVFSD